MLSLNPILAPVIRLIEFFSIKTEIIIQLIFKKIRDFVSYTYVTLGTTICQKFRISSFSQK